MPTTRADGYWRFDSQCELTPEDHERGEACHPFLPHSHRGESIKWARWVTAQALTAADPAPAGASGDADAARTAFIESLYDIFASNVVLEAVVDDAVRGFESAVRATPATPLRDAAQAVSDHHNGEPGHDPNDSCWRVLYAALETP